MGQRPRVTPTNNSRSVLFLESLEDRCTPAGLQLTSLLAPPALASLLPAVTARLDLGNSANPVLATVGQPLSGLVATANNLLSLGGSSRLLGLDVQANLGGTHLLDIGLTAGSGRPTGLGVELHAGVGGSQLINVGLGEGTGNDGPAVLGLSLHVEVGGSQLIDIGLAETGNSVITVLNLQASAGGDKLVSIAVNAGKDSIPQGDMTTKVVVGAPARSLSMWEPSRMVW